jgi:hypothetical protein
MISSSNTQNTSINNDNVVISPTEAEYTLLLNGNSTQPFSEESLYDPEEQKSSDEAEDTLLLTEKDDKPTPFN